MVYGLFGFPHSTPKAFLYKFLFNFTVNLLFLVVSGYLLSSGYTDCVQIRGKFNYKAKPP